jgi:hypothetical protein
MANVLKIYIQQLFGGVARDVAKLVIDLHEFTSARLYQRQTYRSQFENRLESFLTLIQGLVRRLKLPEIPANEQIEQRGGQKNEKEAIHPINPR